MPDGEIVPVAETGQQLTNLSKKEIFDQIDRTLKEASEAPKRSIIEVWFRPGVAETERTRESLKKVALEASKAQIEAMGKLAAVMVTGIQKDLGLTVHELTGAKQMQLTQMIQALREDLILDIWERRAADLVRYGQLANTTDELRKELVEEYLDRAKLDAKRYERQAEQIFDRMAAELAAV